MDINSRIAALRGEMKKAGVHAYIIPSDDPHKSEYVADRWKVREWISGFTGSAGTAVVTLDHAGLWTDARYFLQCETELSVSEFELHKLVVQGMDEYVSWLADHLEEGSAVGINGLQFAPSQVLSYQRIFKQAGIELKTDLDLIDPIWPERSSLPNDQVFEISESVCGESRKSKLTRIRQVMREKGCNFHLVATLDDVAWILNLRGTDVDFNPVFHAFLGIYPDSCVLFIDEVKVPVEIRERLSADGIEIHPYKRVIDYLELLSDETSVLLDKSALNYRLYQAMEHTDLCASALPSRQMKAIKNETEVAHIRRVMVKDGVALTRFYRWLNAEVRQRGVPEAEAAEKLAGFRAQMQGYRGESFSAIIGFKDNGAIIHYRPDYATCADIQGNGVLLVDSGGQYLDGTTDITRTTVFGDPGDEVRKAYTLVLKGHIGLARARFPKGTKGVQLDTLAREHLWDHGMNFGHGTGHGVGFFMNVHEPPQGFTPGLGARGATPHELGMFSSNEPGYYKVGGYGIRIENLILVVEDKTTPDGAFYRFETLTVFPISTDLIDRSLMTDEEVAWLNSYHRKVYQMLAPELNEEEKVWMEEQCKAIA